MASAENETVLLGFTTEKQMPDYQNVEGEAPYYSRFIMFPGGKTDIGREKHTWVRPNEIVGATDNDGDTVLHLSNGREFLIPRSTLWVFQKLDAWYEAHGGQE